MTFAAWTIGITVFILSFISLWGMGLILFLFVCGVATLALYGQIDLFEHFKEEDVNILWGALYGPWILAFMLILLGRLLGFASNVVKAVKNLANDERKTN